VWRETKWEPGIISRLFLDNIDHNGLFYYYEDIHVMNKQIAAIRKNKRK